MFISMTWGKQTCLLSLCIQQYINRDMKVISYTRKSHKLGRSYSPLSKPISSIFLRGLIRCDSSVFSFSTEAQDVSFNLVFNVAMFYPVTGVNKGVGLSFQIICTFIYASTICPKKNYNQTFRINNFKSLK